MRLLNNGQREVRELGKQGCGIFAIDEVLIDQALLEQQSSYWFVHFRHFHNILMCELNRRLPVARGEDDESLLTFWEVVDQTARSLLGPADPHVNVVGVVEHQKPRACALVA